MHRLNSDMVTDYPCLQTRMPSLQRATMTLAGSFMHLMQLLMHTRRYGSLTGTGISAHTSYKCTHNNAATCRLLLRLLPAV